MAISSETCGAELFRNIAKLIRVARLLDGVHCGTTIFRGVDKAIQGIEQPFDFIQYLLHLFFLLRDFDCSNCKCRWLLVHPHTAHQ